MNFEDRVSAVAKLGFTERQARFLTTVMLHAGVCVPRQYARFAGIAYGHKVNRFFDKLVEHRYAVVSACRHNRAELYHIRHHALHAAISQPDSRYRRPVSAQLAIERLMLLDGVLTSPELMWLGDEAEKVAFFELMAPSLPRERLPHMTTGAGDTASIRLFPEQLPIGVSTTGRTVFVYLVATPPRETAGHVEPLQNGRSFGVPSRSTRYPERLVVGRSRHEAARDGLRPLEAAGAK